MKCKRRKSYEIHCRLFCIGGPCFNHPCGWVLFWLRNLSTKLPHCCGNVYGELQMNKDCTLIDSTWLEKTGGFAKNITLRDHYAGLAMQSLISGKDYINEPPKMIALDAYTLADAMLAAKGKT